MATIIPLPVCMLLCSSLHHEMESISFPLASGPGYDLLGQQSVAEAKPRESGLGLHEALKSSLSFMDPAVAT